MKYLKANQTLCHFTPYIIQHLFTATQTLRNIFLYNHNAISTAHKVKADLWVLSKNESIFKCPQLSQKCLFPVCWVSWDSHEICPLYQVIRSLSSLLIQRDSPLTQNKVKQNIDLKKLVDGPVECSRFWNYLSLSLSYHLTSSSCLHISCKWKLALQP